MFYSQNLQKQTRNFFQNGGGARARRAGPGSAFGDINVIIRKIVYTNWKKKPMNPLEIFYIVVNKQWNKQM